MARCVAKPPAAGQLAVLTTGRGRWGSTVLLKTCKQPGEVAPELFCLLTRGQTVSGRDGPRGQRRTNARRSPFAQRRPGDLSEGA